MTDFSNPVSRRALQFLRLFVPVLLAGVVTGQLHAQVNVDSIAADAQKRMKDPKAVPYGHNPAAGKFYELRGIRMYAETYGKGQPLLIIHGNGGSIDNFIYQIPYFQKNYKVIIADSRAQGRSEDPADSLTYEMMADDYAALLDQMKVDSALVIGWSDGGINGLLLAMRHPEKVKKLAVTGANLRPDSSAVPQSVWDMMTPALTQMKANQSPSAQDKQGIKLLGLMIDNPHIPASELSKVQCPTLVIGGDHDVIKESHTMEIFQHIPRAYLWIIPGSGHSTPIMYAPQFNAEVDHFFRTPYRDLNSVQARFQ